MKALCPAGCGKKFITKEHAERHADTEHTDWKIPKRKGWVTPHGFADFSEPVTYETACTATEMAMASEAFKKGRP